MRKLNQNYIAIVSLQSEQLLLKEITKRNLCPCLVRWYVHHDGMIVCGAHDGLMCEPKDLDSLADGMPLATALG